MDDDEHNNKVTKILRDTLPPSSIREFGKWFDYISRELEKVGYKPVIDTLNWDSFKIKVKLIKCKDENEL